jgi:hypothetical protein
MTNFHASFCSFKIVRKSRKMSFAGHVVYMEEERDVQQRPEQLKRSRCSWKNIFLKQGSGIGMCSLLRLCTSCTFL